MPFVIREMLKIYNTFTTDDLGASSCFAVSALYPLDRPRRFASLDRSRRHKVVRRSWNGPRRELEDHKL